MSTSFEKKWFDKLDHHKESLDDLYKILEDKGRGGDSMDLKETMRDNKLEDQNTYLRSLIKRYHPQNNGAETTEIFQQLVSVKDILEERIHAKHIRGLANELADNLETITPEMKAIIEAAQKTIADHQMPKDQVEKAWDALISSVHKMENLPGAQEVIKEVNKMVTTGFADQATRETNNYKRPDVVATENSADFVRADIVTSESDSTQNQHQDFNNNSVNPQYDELQEELDQDKKKRNESPNNNDTTNQNFYHSSSSSEFDLNPLAITAAKFSAALILALTCGPFGFILAGFMLHSVRNIGNNLNVQNHASSGKGLGDEVESQTLQKVIAQLQQQPVTNRTQQISQTGQDSQLVDLNQSSKTIQTKPASQEIQSSQTTDKTMPNQKSRASLRQMTREDNAELQEIRSIRIDSSSIGHLHAPIIPSGGNQDKSH